MLPKVARAGAVAEGQQDPAEAHVGARVGWLERQCATVRDHCCSGLATAGMDLPQIEPGGGEGWTKRGGSIELRDGIMLISIAEQGQSEVNVESRAVRSERHGPSQ